MKPSQVLMLLGALACVEASPVSVAARAIDSGVLRNLQFYAQYSAASYCPANNDSPNTPITCPDSATCPAVQSAQASTIAEWTATTYTGQQGFLAIDPTNKLIVLAFRGSDSVRNFIADANFRLVDFKTNGCSGCQVHDGFSDAYTESVPKFMPQLNSAFSKYPSYKFVITGHSLGGAVATIAAATMRSSSRKADLYTYGSPRVGNAAFANFVTSQAQYGANIRATHVDDPVPRLPPAFFGYRHMSPEYWLYTGSSSTNTYGVNDIKICTGISNSDCNAGQLFEIDIVAHLHYFELISACSPKLGLKKRDDPPLTDDQVKARLKQDYQYMQGVGPNSN